MENGKLESSLKMENENFQAVKWKRLVFFNSVKWNGYALLSPLTLGRAIILAVGGSAIPGVF